MKSVFIVLATLILSNLSWAASLELNAAYSRISKAKSSSDLSTYDLRVSQYLLKLAKKDMKLDTQVEKYIACLDRAQNSSGLIKVIDAGVIACANKYSANLTKEECDLGLPAVGWRASATKLSVACNNAQN